MKGLRNGWEFVKIICKPSHRALSAARRSPNTFAGSNENGVIFIIYSKASGKDAMCCQPSYDSLRGGKLPSGRGRRWVLPAAPELPWGGQRRVLGVQWEPQRMEACFMPTAGYFILC